MSTRRVLLRTGAVASVALLGGCLGSAPTNGSGDGRNLDGDGSGPDGADDSATDDAGGTRPTGTGGPGVTLVDVDDPPELPVRPSIEVVREAATTDHPPQLRATVANESDEPVSVGEGRAIVFAYVTAESGELILLPAGGTYPAEADCWRLTEGIAVTEEYRTVTLEPGESTTRLVDLYGTPDGDGCLPVSEHRFSTTISAAVGPDAMASEGSSARWGFSVLLE
jgi:hypothetical protein